jgi:cysteine-rich repeat protein
MVPEEKFAAVARGEERAVRARASCAARTAAGCDAAAFAALYGHSIEQFLADVGTRADCLVGGVYVQDRLRCPAPQCGNGMEEAGEECDDGNADDTDTCRADCVRTDCPVYANTFDLIQDAIFDRRGCSDDLCHGDANAGGLDLRIGAAYDNIVGVPSMSSDQPRVDPGDAEPAAPGCSPPRRRSDVPTSRPRHADRPTGATQEPDALRLWIDARRASHRQHRRHRALLHACLPPPLDNPIAAGGAAVETGRPARTRKTTPARDPPARSPKPGSLPNPHALGAAPLAAAAPIGESSRLDRAHPDAKLALDFTSPLELLIALILAAQCTDASLRSRRRSSASFTAAAFAAVDQGPSALAQTDRLLPTEVARRPCLLPGTR